MKTKRTTVPADGVKSAVQELVKSGYKELPFGVNRVPTGTKEKMRVIARRWCGVWSGFQVFTVSILYK